MGKRVVFTADLQLHNHAQDSVLLANGLNNRFHFGLESLKQAARLAQGGVLVINGDLFDHRRYLEIDVLVHTFRAMHEIADELDKIILVVGNHDQFLRDGTVHSTEIFRHKKIKLVDTWSIETLGKEYDHMAVCAHAFTEDLDGLKAFIKTAAAQSSPSVLVLHQEVKGADLGKSICEHGLEIADLRAGEFDQVLLGHFHKPQSLGDNIHYIGSPYQVDRAEAGDRKRFIVYQDGEWSISPVTGMPRYVMVEGIKGYEKAVAAGEIEIEDFVEIIATEDDYEEAERIAKEEDNVRAVFVQEKTSEAAVEATERLSELSCEAAVRTWLKNRGREDLIDRAVERLVA